MPLIAILLAVICSCCLASAQAAPPAPDNEWNRETFLKRVRLFEIPDDDTSHMPEGFMKNILEEELPRSLSTEERRVLDRDDTGKWRVYEDELIRFELPDEPLLKISISTPEAPKPAAVVGSAVRTTDITSSRHYIVTVGEQVPYLLIFFSNDTALDSSVCFCGAVKFEKITFAGGVLKRFDFLGSGDIKRAQAVGGAGRAVLHEWTHTAIPQAAYARIAASLALKNKNPLGREAWIEKTGGGPAWIERGMTVSQIQHLLGKTGKLENNALVFAEIMNHGDGSRAKKTLSIPLANDTFGETDLMKETVVNLPPERGTVAWADALGKAFWNSGIWGDSHEAIPASQENLDYFWEQFLNESVTNDPHLWETWCWTAHHLHAGKIENRKIIPLLKKHLLDLTLRPQAAVHVLSAYGQADEMQEILSARIRAEFSALEGKPDGDDATSKLEAALGFDDEFMQYIRAPKRTEWVRKGLKHSSPIIRAKAVSMCGYLPAAEALRIMRRLLDAAATEPEIRQRALHALARNADDWLTRDDLPWVRTLAASAQKASFSEEWLAKWIAKAEAEAITAPPPAKAPAQSSGTSLGKSAGK